MTKRGIIEELMERREGFTYRQSETVVNAMFDAMAGSLARGDRIEIRGFGSFGVKHRRARQGRNPKTGEMVEVEAKRIPFFRAGKELRVEVNGAADSGRKGSA
ncbi:MAG: integration host factor subunit beta [Candidatus Binataceae bacterium]|jgi:integration host factor subunit beta